MGSYSPSPKDLEDSFELLTSGKMNVSGLTTTYSMDEIQKAFDTQKGHINQLPPMYSALKVNGKRMCDLVRSGRSDEINLKARPVHIKELNILSIRENKIMFYVKCSKGTYVRSICYDVGKALGCGGHMSFLLRTSSGKFNLENGITLEDLKEYKDNNKLDNYLYDIDYVLSNFNKVTIHENAIRYYINGGIIDDKRFIEKDFNENDELVRVYSLEEFIGIGKIIRKDNTISLKSDKLFIS
jgi:tRNA pseudouridine55 synthase